VNADRGSIRHEILVHRPAETVWALVGDPTRIQEWFPGIENSEVTGDERVVTLSSGHAITETILTFDPLQRRFQYEIHMPMCRFHLGTIDVVAIDEGRCLVLYGTDAEPAPMALIVGGAASAALQRLGELFEGDT